MGARDSRRTEWTPDVRIRLLEEDLDRIEALLVELKAEFARIKGVALGLLLMVTGSLIMFVLTKGAAR